TMDGIINLTHTDCL
ncbi:hypothetical protein ACJX0J_041985, partial [Zea mays]